MGKMYDAFIKACWILIVSIGSMGALIWITKWTLRVIKGV